ncbi:hypothetical protein E2C01_054869 [Portunus trituberculatus]|uniref:Uncharacterized protein n=1 Tax=Portunus trituberculatus TaxID=210409 RepID=A0A5B7GPR3_PORTR|nr:hypothetical protein [Portunus trituberculatus]
MADLQAPTPPGSARHYWEDHTLPHDYSHPTTCSLAIPVGHKAVQSKLTATTTSAAAVSEASRHAQNAIFRESSAGSRLAAAGSQCGRDEVMVMVMV